MKNDNRPVGIFDSGLGGLTVVSSLKHYLPHENIVYLGDTARVPYGDKSPASITRFAIENTGFLLSHGVKMIVVACNTVSSIAMPKLRSKFPGVHIIGVLEAGVEACLKAKPRSVVIIGTRATVRSDAYRQLIHSSNPQINVISIACPLFVPIVEEGLHEHPIAKMAIELYLGQIKKTRPDVILLACTHYPLLKKALREYLGTKTQIIDSAEACVEYAKKYIRGKGISADLSSNSADRYYVTDMPALFLKQAKRFLGKDLEHFEKISLGKG